MIKKERGKKKVVAKLSWMVQYEFQCWVFFFFFSPLIFWIWPSVRCIFINLLCLLKVEVYVVYAGRVVVLDTTLLDNSMSSCKTPLGKRKKNKSKIWDDIFQNIELRKCGWLFIICHTEETEWNVSADIIFCPLRRHISPQTVRETPFKLNPMIILPRVWLMWGWLLCDGKGCMRNSTWEALHILGEAGIIY